MVDDFYAFSNECKINRVDYLPISQWIAQEFSLTDAMYITDKVGGWSFFKSYEKNGLNKLEFLEFLEKSFQAKKDINIYSLVIDKLKQIAPNELGCDPELYATDTNYRVWFLSRENFFTILNEATNHPENRYLVWDAVSDNRSHQDCLDINNKVFTIGKEFIDIAEKHWSRVNSGCRCGLSIMTARQLDKFGLKAP